MVFRVLQAVVMETLDEPNETDNSPETKVTQTVSKQTQTESIWGSLEKPTQTELVQQLRAKKAQIREQIATHFINLHNCSRLAKRCATIGRLQLFWEDKTPRKTNPRQCYKGQNTKLIPTTIQYCPICNTMIDQTNLNHLALCIQNNIQTLVSCMFCNIQIKTDDIKTHLASHSCMLQELRAPYSVQNQTECKRIAEQTFILIQISSRQQQQLVTLMNEWLHATFCSTHCTTCNTVSYALNELSRHTLDASLNTDHYCICMPLYHYTLRHHIITCSTTGCPLIECRITDTYEFIPEIQLNKEA